jgi:hypothetical protein
MDGILIRHRSRHDNLQLSQHSHLISIQLLNPQLSHHLNHQDNQLIVLLTSRPDSRLHNHLISPQSSHHHNRRKGHRNSQLDSQLNLRLVNLQGSPPNNL